MSLLSAALPAANPEGVNYTALVILIALFLVVTVMGFLATRWRRR